VRNSFFVSLAVVAYPFAAASAPLSSIGGTMWFIIIFKEIFIGLCIGFLFGIVFWAIGNVGNLIDTKAGTTMASVVDPLQGHQTSLTASFLSRLAGWLFMASGGFLVFLDLLFGSYAVWPVTAGLPTLSRAGELVFVGGFAKMMVLSLLLAAPALVVLALIDIGLGLINRYAQQLNVFMLSLAIKAWLSVWLVLLCLGVFVEFILRHVAESSDALETLQRVIR
jgi:type III secretion protein T